MSATIDARRYRAKDASVFQHRPSSLINTGESDERAARFRFTGGAPRAIRMLDIPRARIGAIGAISIDFLGPAQPINNNPRTGGTEAIHYELLGATGTSWELAATDADDWAKWVETTKELFKKRETDSKSEDSASAKLRIERLASIQAALGVSSQAFAEILRISRQGLYKWLDASKDTTLQEANRLRLTSVERIAKRWRQQSVAPLNTVIHETLTNGRTLFEILTDKELDEARVGDTFSELLDKLNRKPRSLSQKMAEAGFTRRPTGRVSRDDE